MKKILAVLAAAAVALSLVGCVGEDGINWPSYTKDKQNKIGFYAQVAPNTTLDGTWYIPDTVFYAGDDTEGAIKGNNDNYSINHENKTDGKYRAYKETAFKHAGALVKVTFNTTNTSSSKLGVVFDLKKSANEGADDFYAIAVGQEGGGTYYVSKFTNVTNIQAENFGTELTTNPAIEKAIVPIKTGNLSSKMPKAVEGKTSVCIYFKLAADGSFDWALLDLTDDEMKDFKGAKKFLEANIDDYNVLVKGNTKAVAGPEYEEAPVEKASLF